MVCLFIFTVVMLLGEGKKYTYIERFFSFKKNNENTRLPLDFEKIRLYVGVFSLL